MPIDVAGNPCVVGAWYWAKGRDGNVKATGKFIMQGSVPWFTINGTKYGTGTFAAYAVSEVPEPLFE